MDGINLNSLAKARDTSDHALRLNQDTGQVQPFKLGFGQRMVAAIFGLSGKDQAEAKTVVSALTQSLEAEFGKDVAQYVMKGRQSLVDGKKPLTLREAKQIVSDAKAAVSTRNERVASQYIIGKLGRDKGFSTYENAKGWGAFMAAVRAEASFSSKPLTKSKLDLIAVQVFGSERGADDPELEALKDKFVLQHPEVIASGNKRYAVDDVMARATALSSQDLSTSDLFDTSLLAEEDGKTWFNETKQGLETFLSTASATRDSLLEIKSSTNNQALHAQIDAVLAPLSQKIAHADLALNPPTEPERFTQNFDAPLSGRLADTYRQDIETNFKPSAVNHVSQHFLNDLDNDVTIESEPIDDYASRNHIEDGDPKTRRAKAVEHYFNEKLGADAGPALEHVTSFANQRLLLAVGEHNREGHGVSSEVQPGMLSGDIQRELSFDFKISDGKVHVSGHYATNGVSSYTNAEGVSVACDPSASTMEYRVSAEYTPAGKSGEPYSLNVSAGSYGHSLVPAAHITFDSV